MKINNINSYYNNSNSHNNAKSKSEVVKKDTIMISDMAKKLQKIGVEEGVSDNKKLEEIKKMIDEGTYKVDTKVLAENILKSIKEYKNE